MSAVGYPHEWFPVTPKNASFSIELKGIPFKGEDVPSGFPSIRSIASLGLRSLFLYPVEVLANCEKLYWDNELSVIWGTGQMYPIFSAVQPREADKPQEAAQQLYLTDQLVVSEFDLLANATKSYYDALPSPLVTARKTRYYEVLGLFTRMGQTFRALLIGMYAVKSSVYDTYGPDLTATGRPVTRQRRRKRRHRLPDGAGEVVPDSRSRRACAHFKFSLMQDPESAALDLKTLANDCKEWDEGNAPRPLSRLISHIQSKAAAGVFARTISKCLTGHPPVSTGAADSDDS